MPNHPWAAQCKQVFLDSLVLKKQLRSELSLEENTDRSALEERLDRLLDQTIDKEHKEVMTLLNRLKKYREHLIVFLHEYDVPADNNGSERAIRNVKVKAKVSGQFRSFRGAQNFVTLRSVIDTLIKQSLEILPNLQVVAMS